MAFSRDSRETAAGEASSPASTTKAITEVWEVVVTTAATAIASITVPFPFGQIEDSSWGT